MLSLVVSILGRPRSALLRWSLGPFRFLSFSRGLKILNPLLRLLHPQFSIIELVTIVVHSLSRSLITLKSNESESSILPSLPIFGQSNGQDGPAITKQVSKVFFSAAERQVAHIDRVLLDKTESVSDSLNVEVGSVKLLKKPHLTFQVLLLNLHSLLHLGEIQSDLINSG